MPILGTIASSRLTTVAGAYEYISRADITSGVSSVTLSNIPQTYQHLELRYIGRNGRPNDTNGFLGLQINGSYTTGYSALYYSTGAAPSALDSNNPGSGEGYQLFATGANANASAFGTGFIQFVNYASTSKLKTIKMMGGSPCGVSSNTMGLTTFFVNNTTAITSITITGIDGYNIIAGSKFYLYGLKAS